MSLLKNVAGVVWMPCIITLCLWKVGGVTPRSTNQWDTNTGFVETTYWLIAWIRRVDGVYDIISLYLMGVINTLKTRGPNLVSRWLLHGVSQDVTVLAQWTMDTLKHPKTLNNRSREVPKIAFGTGSSNYNLYNIYIYDIIWLCKIYTYLMESKLQYYQLSSWQLTNSMTITDQIRAMFCWERYVF